MNQIDLAGKTAVVTGGTRGIGLAIVERMAKSGARVAVWDRARLEKGSKAEAAGAILIAADVSDPDAVARALAETESRVGPGRYPGQQRRRSPASTRRSRNIRSTNGVP